MKKESIEFLRALVATPSPSGYEMGIQEILRERFGSVCDEVRTDVHGNLIGVINPSAPFRVMLAGHCDEIGFMVMHIDDKGFISFSAVGGLDPNVAIGQRVVVHGRKGGVAGVIGRKPIHLMERDEAGKSVRLQDLWIDIGARNRKDAERRISIGDYATIDVGFQELDHGLVAARGFDDRAGAFVVAETLRRLKGRPLKVGVYGVTTVQEEIGLRGAHTSAYGIDPRVGIAVDVGFATDYPGGEPKRTGAAALGKGPQVHRGPNINPALGRMMEDAARKAKIPVQLIAEPRGTPTDANAIQLSRGGVAAGLLSISCRYIHTPVEVLSLEDLDQASRLLAALIESFTGHEDFTPRRG